MNFYVSVFKNAKIVSILRYPDEVMDEHMKGFEGKVLTGIIELEGQRFMALDGGPHFKFTEATSFYVECSNQEEVDYYWGKLSAVPTSEQCGWLKDKYGMSWQIIPKQLGELLGDQNATKAMAVMQVMMNMKKIVIADLQNAYDAA